jgi:hypothetical protein
MLRSLNWIKECGFFENLVSSNHMLRLLALDGDSIRGALAAPGCASIGMGAA